MRDLLRALLFQDGEDGLRLDGCHLGNFFSSFGVDLPTLDDNLVW